MLSRLLLVIALLLAAAAGAFHLLGRPLSQSAAVDFLDDISQSVSNGQADPICNRIAEQAVFDLEDNAQRVPQAVSGGRQALCDYFRLQAASYAAGIAKDSFYRTDLAVHRDWRHWQSATISYREHHDVQRLGSTGIKSVSSEEIDVTAGERGLLIHAWRIRSTPAP